MSALRSLPHYTAVSSEDENCFSTTLSDGRQNFSWTYTRSPTQATNPSERRTADVHSPRVSFALPLLRIEDFNSCPNGNIPSPRRRPKTQREQRSIEFPFESSQTRER
jgi:hypothetical protein